MKNKGRIGSSVDDFLKEEGIYAEVTARAINKVGQTQTAELIQNPAGYHHNVMQTITLNVA